MTPPLSAPVLFFFLSVLLTCQLSESSSAPWHSQSARSNVLEEDLSKHLPPIVFSESGRLYSIERMTEAASNPEDASSNVAVAVSYQGGIVVISSRPQSPHLVYDHQNNGTATTKTTLHLDLKRPTRPNYQVGPYVYATTAGNAADSQLLRDKVLKISAMLWEGRNGLQTKSIPLPPSILARHVADHLQRPTQRITSGKILASQALIWDSMSLWRIDPSGQFWKCRAAAIGRSRYAVEDFLTKKFENMTNTPLTKEDAIRVAVESVQSGFPEALLEGLIVTNQKKSFALTHAELTKDQKDNNEL